jgi:AraC family transcriptional regulator
MATTPELLRIAQRIHRHLPGRHSLRELAAQVQLSPFDLQRAFTRLAGESPARYARQLRLLFVATELLGSDAPLRHIARRAGFASPEVLIRNFRLRFGQTPDQYRRLNAPAHRDARFRSGLRRLNRCAPCFNLYHLSAPTPRSRPAMPMLSATVRTIPPQHALIIRSRVARDEIAATIGQSLGRIVPHALGAGGALAGQPFARYPEFGAGLITIEVGMPLAAPVPGSGDIEAFTLPAGPTAVAVHGGPYDKLPETFVAFEKWIAAQGHSCGGAPWEVYVTDPADHPDAADWRTEIYWPVR